MNASYKFLHKVIKSMTYKSLPLNERIQWKVELIGMGDNIIKYYTLPPSLR